MRRTLFVTTAVALLATALALALALGAAGVSGTGVSTSAPGGSSETIGVHGHWTIEVREPDGTLAQRRELDNALALGGLMLKEFLSRQKVPGRWHVQLGPAADGPCFKSADDQSPFPCFILEPELSVTYVSALPDVNPLVLNGTATAERDGTVASVHASLGFCASTMTPPACASTQVSNRGFSGTNITPVSVREGQQVEVTVEIDFG